MRRRKEGGRERTRKRHDGRERSDTEVRYEVGSGVSNGKNGDSDDGVGETEEFPEHREDGDDFVGCREERKREDASVSTKLFRGERERKSNSHRMP